MNNRMTTVLWFLLGVSLTLAAVLGIMVLTDDGGDGGAASTEATTTTVLATTTSVDTSTTAATTSTAATTTTAAPGCLAPSATTPPIPSPGVSIASGDFDHDGAMDLLIGYESGGTYWIQMALNGYATEIEAMDAAEAIGAQPFAEGDAWLGLAKVGTGASTDILQWFMLDGCEIVKATIDGTFEASFISGGGVMHGDGLECTRNGFITRSVQTSDGTNWEYFTNTYTWDPVARTFLSGGVASSTLVSPADDDIIFSAYALICPFAP